MILRGISPGVLVVGGHTLEGGVIVAAVVEAEVGARATVGGQYIFLHLICLGLLVFLSCINDSMYFMSSKSPKAKSSQRSPVKSRSRSASPARSRSKSSSLSGYVLSFC